MPRYLTAEETARRLRVKVATVYAYVSRGLLSPEKSSDGRRSFFAVDDVEALARRARGGKERDRNFASIRTEITRLTDEGHRYRGHAVSDLVDRSFEDVAELIWLSPAARWVPMTLRMPDVPLARDAVRVSVALSAALDPFRSDHRPDAVVEAASCLIATVVGSLEPATGRADGSISGQLARWLSAGSADEAVVAAVNAALVLLADHELSNPTLAVRLAADARTDLYDAMLAGLGVIGGELHGGSSEVAHRMLQRCDEVGVEAALDEVVRWRGGPAGFSNGYRATGDPRFHALRPFLTKILSPEAATLLDALLLRVEQRRFPPPNIDLGLAALSWAVGADATSGPVLFSIARMAGWTAHYLEALSEPPMRFRARAVYVSSAMESALSPEPPPTRPIG